MTITDEYQPDLFGPPRVTVNGAPKLTTEEQWEQFRRRNGWFMVELAKLAYEARERGQRFSTKAGFEIIRARLSESGNPIRLNNSRSSP